MKELNKKLSIIKKDDILKKENEKLNQQIMNLKNEKEKLQQILHFKKENVNFIQFNNNNELKGSIVIYFRFENGKVIPVNINKNSGLKDALNILKNKNNIEIDGYKFKLNARDITNDFINNKKIIDCNIISNSIILVMR